MHNTTEIDLTPSDSHHKLLDILFYANAIYFLILTCILITNLAPAVGPDEMYHLQMIDIYRNALHFFPLTEGWTSYPIPSSKFQHLGGTTEFPYLYHMLFGWLLRILHLDTFNFHTIIFLRFLNLGLFLATLKSIDSFLRELSINVSMRKIANIFLTNIPMLTFMSCVVIYDNAQSLIASLCLLLFARLNNKRRLQDLVILLVLLCIGSLIKLSFIPLAIILVFLLAIDSLLNKKKIYVQNSSILNLAISTTTLLIFVFLNAEFYLGNYLQYSTIAPSCQSIFPSYPCIFYDGTSPEQIARAAETDFRMNPISYFTAWSYQMITTIIGIKSFYMIELPFEINLFFSIFVLIIFLTFIIKQPPTFINTSFSLVFLVYLLFLAFYRNYGTYLQLGDYEIGVNGRYAFIVLPIFIYMLASLLNSNKNTRKTLNISLGIYIVLFFMQIKVFSQSNIFFIPDENYYKNTGYYPNPTYDKNFQIISNNPKNNIALK